MLFYAPVFPFLGNLITCIRPFVIVTQVSLVLIIKTSKFLFLGLVNSFRFPHSILCHIIWLLNSYLEFLISNNFPLKMDHILGLNIFLNSLLNILMLRGRDY